MLAPRQTQQLARANNCETIRPAERDTSTRKPEKLVRTYRLYIFDPFNGGIAETRRFAVPDDETAVWISEGFRHSRPMELWSGPTKIQSWSAVGATTAPEDPGSDFQMPNPTPVPN